MHAITEMHTLFGENLELFARVSQKNPRVSQSVTLNNE